MAMGANGCKWVHLYIYCIFLLIYIKGAVMGKLKMPEALRDAVEDTPVRRRVRATQEAVSDRSTEGRVRTNWYVLGSTYHCKRAAAEALGVSADTIKRWCKGYNKGGVFVKPRKGCSAEEV